MYSSLACCGFPLTTLSAGRDVRGLSVRRPVLTSPAPASWLQRDGLDIIVAKVKGVFDLAVNNCCAYVWVDDACAPFEAWVTADLDGRVNAPVRTDYGLTEGAHADPDGDLTNRGLPIEVMPVLCGRPAAGTGGWHRLGQIDEEEPDRAYQLLPGASSTLRSLLGARGVVWDVLAGI